MTSFLTVTPRNSIISNFVRTTLIRSYSEAAGADTGGGINSRKGLVLGVFTDDEGKEHKLTSAAKQFNNHIKGKLEEVLKIAPHLKKGKGHVFQNLDSEYFSVAVVGLGKENVGFSPIENLDECKETIRVCAAVGARKLRKIGMTNIHLEGFGHTESAAEGAGLAVWRYHGQRNKAKRKTTPVLELYHDDDKEGWQRGLFKAEAQNLARRLCDTPANLMTPALFAQNSVDALCQCGVGVQVRDKDWLENKKFHAFLSVARGSCEPPVLMELSYCGGKQEERPIVLVAKGITYDSGGLNLKKCRAMPEYRGDMTGAAVTVAVMRAVAALMLPINVQAIIPLCENMPSGMAMKPGDVVRALNHMSVRIDDTDNEGRLILADALVYASNHLTPRITIDIGSLTNGMRAALGSGATGVFTNNHDLWKQMQIAGATSGDRVWRFPLWEHFRKKVTGITSADLTNVGKGGGYPCKAASFLKEFVPCGDWIHMDTTGTGMLANAIDFPYLSVNRMTGRPTRTLIQFLYQLSCPPTKKKQSKAKV